MISIGRFQRRPIPSEPTNKRLLKKRAVKHQAPYLIGADMNLISTEASVMPIEAFGDATNSNAMTLTQREADLIALANPGVKPPSAAESVYPWLPQQKYVEDAILNRSRLVQTLSKFKGHAFLAADFCDAAWNTICNAVRMTNGLDVAFYHAWHLPLQEAYVLEETRPDRKVIAIDFNAMYGACMQEAFPKPSTLRRVHYDRPLIHGEILPVGLYRCQLGGEITDFIRTYNPFRAFYAGRYLGVSLADGIEVDLNEFEISFYAKHFSKLHIGDAVVSDTVIKHPLAKEAMRSFTRRLNYKVQGNKPLADCEKFRMTLLSSCANRPGSEAVSFDRQADAMAFLNYDLGIKQCQGEPDKVFAGWLTGRRGVAMRIDAAMTVIEAPKLGAGTACFSLSQRIVARGRTKLLQMMERIAQISSDVEICYCNIDSIHFSLPEVRVSEVMKILECEATPDMGSFKIEAVANHGLWLEPGRYWLYSDTVVKFGNQGINHGSSPFKTDAVHVTSRSIAGLSIPTKIRIDMAKSLSDAKKVVWNAQAGHWKHEAMMLSESTDFDDFTNAIGGNRDSVHLKLEAFKRLQSIMAG